MGSFKQAIRKLGADFGTHVLRRRPPEVGQSALADMKRFVPADARPLILDVGANTGQSVKRFRKAFPSPIIHSFEPSQRVFDQLKTNVAGKEGVFAWNCALGASVGKQTFLENTHSDMSSFLPLSKTGWGKIVQESTVDVTTVDQFLADQQIERVDILKSDTQGYDFEVIQGAEQTIRRNAVGLLYFEFIFSEMYKNLPRFDVVFRHLTDRGFLLVSIYEMRHQNNVASWADALFVNKEYWAAAGKRAQVGSG
jgi:FkbM family methyltransferase